MIDEFNRTTVRRMRRGLAPRGTDRRLHGPYAFGTAAYSVVEIL